MRRCASAPPPRTATGSQLRTFFHIQPKVPGGGTKGIGYFGPLFPAIGGGAVRNQPYLGPSSLPGTYPGPTTGELNPRVYPGILTEGDQNVTWTRAGERQVTLDFDWCPKWSCIDGEFSWKRNMGRWGPRFSMETGKRCGAHSGMYAISGGGGNNNVYSYAAASGRGRYYDVDEQSCQRPPIHPLRGYERKGEVGQIMRRQWIVQYKKWLKELIKHGSAPMDSRNEIISRTSTMSHEDYKIYMEKHAKYTEEELLSMAGSDFKNGRVGKFTEFFARTYAENATCWWNNTCRWTDPQVVSGKMRMNMHNNRPMNTTAAGIHSWGTVREGASWGRTPESCGYTPPKLGVGLSRGWFCGSGTGQNLRSYPTCDAYHPFWNEKGEPCNEENTATYATINFQKYHHTNILEHHPLYVPYIVHDTQGNLVHKFMSGDQRASGPVRMDMSGTKSSPQMGYMAENTGDITTSHHYKWLKHKNLDPMEVDMVKLSSHIGERQPWAPATDTEEKAVATQ